jgi:uncharacterized protein (DUF1800 family)
MFRSRSFRLLLILQLTFTPAWAVAGGPNANTRTLNEEQRIIHLLNRIGFGPKPGNVEKVRQMGVERYVELQLHPEAIQDSTVETRLQALKTLTMSSEELADSFPPLRQKTGTSRAENDGKRTPSVIDTPEERREMTASGLKGPRRVIAELGEAKILRAVYSERQLYEVMVDFWTNHFNVFAAKGANKWLITSYDRDAIRPHAMGNFKDLLMATAKSPAMLFYLDNWMSSDPKAGEKLSRMAEFRANRFPFDNSRGFGSLRRLQRELGRRDRQPQTSSPVPEGKEKRRLGLNENYARELMELHTLGVDGGYTQNDILEVARCFSGWTIARPRQGGGFAFIKFMHDDGEKTVLDHKIPSGGGIQDGERVLDILVHHPSTAKFIATKLTRHFVADEPPPSLVSRVADVYRTMEGNITAMLRTILTSPEFNSAEVYRAKVKRPFELVVSSMRALGAETDGGPPILRQLAEMGEPLFLCQPPTGYTDIAEAWVSSGALLNRLNFGLALAANRLPGTRVELQQFIADRKMRAPEQLLTHLAEIIVQGELSERTLTPLKKQMERTDSVNSEFEDARGIGPAKIVGLLLGSPEFQRQ